MKSNINSLKTLALVVLFVPSFLALSGCSVLQKSNADDSDQSAQATDSKGGVSGDITRPPQVIKDKSATTVETSPDETISFEEWRKKRQAELDAKAKAQAE